MPQIEITTSDKYRARSAERINARMLGGWGRAYARQNQMLPYAGTSLTAAEVEMLGRHLDARACSATQSEITSAALLSAILTTGRSAESFAGIPVLCETANLPNAPCLTIGAQWVWWLEPGRPSSEQKFRGVPEPAQAKRGNLIALPCSVRTRRLLEQMVAAPTAGQTVFPWNSDEAHDAAHKEIRKAAVRSSLRLAEGWLFQRLTEMENGDTAVAAIITGNVPLIAKTVIHYTSVSDSMAVTILGKALDGFDIVEPLLNSGDEKRYGSRYAPPIRDLSNLLAQVRAPLSIRRNLRKKPIVAIHNAMTLYTVLFYLIATCARPTRALLPSLDRIDPLTGYQMLDDKPSKDRPKTRLIWVSEECQEQLAFYDSHLQTMYERYPQLVPDGHDGSPYLIADDGSLQVLDRALLRRTLRDKGWPYPSNFARHFVRSALIGRISSETLHAFFGHWHQGTEPWNKTAGLDPLAYRAELKRAITALCECCGLEPQRGL